jgi:large subunit ribosomal protein L11
VDKKKKAETVGKLPKIKLHILAGKASPAPPVGPALGQKGVNIMAFCKEFNAKTAAMPSDAKIPVTIYVKKDKSFQIKYTKPTASYFLKKAASLNKGSSAPGRETTGQITEEQLHEIAKEKFEDMNAFDLEEAKKILAGTARSMGISIEVA